MTGDSYDTFDHTCPEDARGPADRTEPAIPDGGMDTEGPNPVSTNAPRGTSKPKVQRSFTAGGLIAGGEPVRTWIQPDEKVIHRDGSVWQMGPDGAWVRVGSWSQSGAREMLHLLNGETMPEPLAGGAS